jgi:uncharacterized protein (DUF2384 family)
LLKSKILGKFPKIYWLVGYNHLVGETKMDQFELIRRVYNNIPADPAPVIEEIEEVNETENRYSQEKAEEFTAREYERLREVERKQAEERTKGATLATIVATALVFKAVKAL